MKTIITSLALCFTLVVVAQNFNATTGAFSGTPVTSLNLNFSTLAASALATATTTVSEVAVTPTSVGLQNYSTALRAYPFGGVNTVVLTMKAATTTVCYVYLPTLSNGAGTLTLDAQIANALSTTTSQISVESSVDGGTTWIAQGNTTVYGGSVAPAAIELGIAGSVQFRLKYTSTGAFFMIKSVAISQFVPTYSAVGAFIGIPVSSINMDFTSLATGIAASSTLTEKKGAGIVNLSTDARAYPVSGGTSSVVLQSIVTGVSYVYLPTLSNGAGAMTINAGLLTAAATSTDLIVESSTNGTTWTQVANPTINSVAAPAAINLNITGSIQLRIKFTNAGPYFILKSINVGSYVHYDVTPSALKFTTLTDQAAWRTSINGTSTAGTVSTAVSGRLAISGGQILSSTATFTNILNGLFLTPTGFRFAGQNSLAPNKATASITGDVNFNFYINKSTPDFVTGNTYRISYTINTNSSPSTLVLSMVVNGTVVPSSSMTTTASNSTNQTYFKTVAGNSSWPLEIKIAAVTGILDNMIIDISDIKYEVYDAVGQAITFNALSAKNYGDGTSTLSATGGASGNPVVFTSSNTAIATCTGTNGTTLSIIGAGTCNINANQASGGGYTAAAQTPRSLTVAPKALTISSPATTSKLYTGTNTAVITGTLTGIINSDDVTLSGTGTFASVNVGNGISVTSTSTITGTKAGNYSLIQPTGLAGNITATESPLAGGNLNNSGLSDAQLANTNLTISSGEFVIDAVKTVQSFTVAPGAKLTLSSGSITATNGITLQSDASGTATFVDTNTSSPQAVSATVQQYLPQGRNWYVSSPVTVATANTSNLLVAGAATSVSYYNEAGSAWVDDYTGALTPGVGYLAFSSTGSGTNNVVFTGALNTGNVAVALTRKGATKSGFNLVANPYPSYLDAMAAINANANVMPSIWYRTRAAGGTYYFETVNTASGIGTNDAGTGMVTGWVPPMQAFWVRTNADNQTITFTNAMRKHAGNAPLTAGGTVPTTPMKAKAANASVLIRLQLANAVTNNETVLYSYDGASNEFDAYDSQKYWNSNTVSELYTTVGTEALVINGMNTIPLDTEIPLGLKTESSTTLSIKATELTNLAPGVKVMVKDKLYPAEFDLTNGEVFNFTSAAVTTTDRFSLILKSPGAITNLATAQQLNVLAYGNAQHQIAVQFNNPSANTAVLTVFNALGQKTLEKQIGTSVKQTTESVTPGVYMVSLTVNGVKATRKVVVR